MRGTNDEFCFGWLSLKPMDSLHSINSSCSMDNDCEEEDTDKGDQEEAGEKNVVRIC